MQLSTAQFFQPLHYAAFDLTKPSLDDKIIVRERQSVRDRFLKLHDDRLWHFIEVQDWRAV